MAFRSIDDTATITLTVTVLEVVALKKLSLVSHALAKRLDGQASREQECLAKVLDDLIRQIELKALAA